MIYHNIHRRVEAEPVSLAGERYYAVCLEGKAHLVHGPAFELLYGAEIEVRTEAVLADVLPVVEPARRPGKRAAKKATGAKPGRKPGRKPKAVVEAPWVEVAMAKPAAAAPAEMTVPERILAALLAGPLTTAEIGSHLYPDEKDAKKRADRIYQGMVPLKDAKLIVRREDPETRLDKWFRV